MAANKRAGPVPDEIKETLDSTSLVPGKQPQHKPLTSRRGLVNSPSGQTKPPVPQEKESRLTTLKKRLTRKKSGASKTG